MEHRLTRELYFLLKPMIEIDCNTRTEEKFFIENNVKVHETVKGCIVGLYSIMEYAIKLSIYGSWPAQPLATSGVP